MTANRTWAVHCLRRLDPGKLITGRTENPASTCCATRIRTWDGYNLNCRSPARTERGFSYPDELWLQRIAWEGMGQPSRKAHLHQAIHVRFNNHQKGRQAVVGSAGRGVEGLHILTDTMGSPFEPYAIVCDSSTPSAIFLARLGLTFYND